MTLPNELILDILQYDQYITKVDLKSARLVSKAWSYCASERLFSKLFISPHQLNTQVFAAIARDPLLSKCVKELQFDTVNFSPDVTETEYFAILWYQTYRILSAQKWGFKESDPEISVFITMYRDCQKKGLKLSAVQGQCLDFAFVQEGYRKWMDQAAFAKRCSEENTFHKLLVAGLRRFDRLSTVKLRDASPCKGKPGCEGSPLTRSWQPFHAHPGASISVSDPIRQEPIRSNNFWTLVYALSEAGKPSIHSLSVEGFLNPTAFVAKPGDNQTHVDCGVAAYYRLEDLKLSFARHSGQARAEIYGNLHSLGRMLECMAALKRCDLCLPSDCIMECVGLLPYKMVFPKDGHWPQLTTLTLRNLAIGTKDLITLLITKMPSLRHLVLGNINLLEGVWQGLVEYLRVANHLSSFEIAPGSQLLHRESQIPRFGITRLYHHCYLNEGRSSDFRESIGDYVVNWWNNPTLRHPSLDSHQPAHRSLDYLPEVFRLCEILDMEETLKELAEHMMEEAERYRQCHESSTQKRRLEICL